MKKKLSGASYLLTKQFGFSFLKSSQKGQVIIILLLLMLVALSIGLALTQRSITDVTTSTQTEQATRAFSAAEAGIEKVLASPLPLGTIIALDNNSSARIDASGLLPYAGSPAAGIEYPKIGRETTAQFWFVDPTSVGVPTAGYNQPSFVLYFGNENTTDLPAVEVNVVMLSNGAFWTETYYLDSNSARTQLPNGNRFTPVGGTGSENLAVGILGNNRKFFRRYTIANIPNLGGSGNCGTPSCILIMARIRFLYINENHSLAIEPVSPGRFPPQIRIYNATGIAGQSQKQIQAFKVEDVVEPWFDFALFSINELRK